MPLTSGVQPSRLGAEGRCRVCLWARYGLWGQCGVQAWSSRGLVWLCGVRRSSDVDLQSGVGGEKQPGPDLDVWGDVGRVEREGMARP